MSANPLKVGTFTSGVFGRDDLPLLVGFHSQQLLVMPRWQDIGPYRQSNDGPSMELLPREEAWCKWAKQNKIVHSSVVAVVRWLAGQAPLWE